MARCSSRFFLCIVELTLHQSVKSVSTKKTLSNAITESRPGPEAAAAQHSSPWTVGMMLFLPNSLLFYTRCYRMNPFQKVQHLPCHSRKYFPKRSKGSKTFLGKW